MLRSILLSLWIATPQVKSFLAPVPLPAGTSTSYVPSRTSSIPTTRHFLFSGASFGGDEESQDVVTLRSLSDFHQGTWKGQARSFTVTSDVAAGIVQRQISPSYTTTVQIGLDMRKQDVVLKEMIDWGSDDGDEDDDEEEDTSSERRVSLTNAHADIDEVDGSYSLDYSSTTAAAWPMVLMGTTKPTGWALEHCVATSDKTRARCWAVYGDDDETLMRVVVATEERVATIDANRDPSSSFTAQDWMDIQGDVDRLVSKIVGTANQTQLPSSSSDDDEVVSLESIMPSSPLEALTQRSAGIGKSPRTTEGDGSQPLEAHPVNLLEVSSGVWLGDCIIRDVSSELPPPSLVEGGGGGRGFGSGKSRKNNGDKVPFASWTTGVQKAAWRWMWNFGDEIRQVNDFGKSLGATLDAGLTSGGDWPGTVCVNQGLSRRIPVADRMVYLDWSGADAVGFLVENYSIQVPRFIKFDRTRRQQKQGRPFFTEFAVFQKSSPNDDNDDEEKEPELPQVVCSKIGRVYNHDGQFQQGCTSFFTLKRFGLESE